MKTQLEEILENHITYYETSKEEVVSELLSLFNVRVRLTTSEKAKAASKWADERSEGDKDVDRQCYYDYLMGMEEAERMLK